MDSINRPPMTAQQRLAKKYATEAEEAGKRPLHHSPLFWGGVVLFVIAISVFMYTDPLAWMPLRSH